MIDASIELEYSKKFWDLANAVTGFAIVQMIAYVLSAGATDSKIRDGIILYRRFVMSLLWFFAIMYCVFVTLLCGWQVDLLTDHASQLRIKMWVVAGVRVFAILLITGLSHWVTKTLKPTVTPPERT